MTAENVLDKGIEHTTELLKKTSPEAKSLSRGQGHRQEIVPFEEIEDILLGFHSGSTVADIYRAIGLNEKTYRDAKSKGYTRKVNKYALLGFLLEQNQASQPSFTFDQLGIIFSALVSHLGTRAEAHKPEVREIMKLISKLMVEE